MTTFDSGQHFSLAQQSAMQSKLLPLLPKPLILKESWESLVCLDKVSYRVHFWASVKGIEYRVWNNVSTWARQGKKSPQNLGGFNPQSPVSSIKHPSCSLPTSLKRSVRLWSANTTQTHSSPALFFPCSREWCGMWGPTIGLLKSHQVVGKWWPYAELHKWRITRERSTARKQACKQLLTW